jgi:hypothetical protein
LQLTLIGGAGGDGASSPLLPSSIGGAGAEVTGELGANSGEVLALYVGNDGYSGSTDPGQGDCDVYGAMGFEYGGSAGAGPAGECTVETEEVAVALARFWSAAKACLKPSPVVVAVVVARESRKTIPVEMEVAGGPGQA